MKYFFLLLLVFALIFSVTRCDIAKSPIEVTADPSSDYQVNILKDEMPAGEYNHSEWINDATAGGTLLVSDNFTVTITGGIVI